MMFKKYCKNHAHPIKLIRDVCPLCSALETIGIMETEIKYLKVIVAESKEHYFKLDMEKKNKEDEVFKMDEMIRTLQDYIISLEGRLKA